MSMELDFENPAAAPVPPVKQPKKQPKKATTVKSPAKKMKIGWVLLTYLIAAACFAVGVIICSVDNGALDRSISQAIANNPDLDPVGNFMDPSPFLGLFEALFEDDISVEINKWINETWASGNIGQLVSEVYLVFAFILLVVVLSQYGVQKKKAIAQYKVENPDWTARATGAEGKKKLSKQQLGEVKITMPASAKLFKYLMLILIVGITTLVATQILMKGIWGRARPYQVNDIDIFFTPWWVIQDTGWKSFWSGHTAQATIMTTLVFSFLGSRKRWVAPVLGVAVAFYVVMMGLSSDLR